MERNGYLQKVINSIGMDTFLWKVGNKGGRINHFLLMAFFLLRL